jgi:TIGR00252 family protein
VPVAAPDARGMKGRQGEERAALFLKQQGYDVIGRNYRERGGEIDIIALYGETVVFVEVKTLPNGTLETLAHELNLVKQQKIIKTAKLYLQKHREYSNRYIRFDVLAVDVPGLEPVHHIVNAFSE